MPFMSVLNEDSVPAGNPKGCFYAACLAFVVIGLGVALIIPTLMLPAMRAGFANRRGAQCVGNLKAVGSAFQLYTRDFDGRFPPASLWIDATLPYVKNLGLFRCPAVVKDNPDDFGYAMNSRLSMRAPSELLGVLPGSALLVYDSANVAQRNASDPGTSMPQVGRHEEAGVRVNNAVYADGHVKSIPRDQGSPDQSPAPQ